MSFAINEVSRYYGQPIELYEFIHGNGVDEWYFTSADEEITYGGETYTPVNLKRGNFRIEANPGTSELRLTVPVDNAIAQLFRNYSPSNPIDLTIKRKHRQDGAATHIVIWNGRISSVLFTSSFATIICENYLSLLKRISPRYRHQLMCQHSLGDTRCGIDLENDTDPGAGNYDQSQAFKLTPVNIDEFQAGDKTRIKSSSLNFEAENIVYHSFFTGGYAIHDLGGNPTYQKRLIIKHDGNDPEADNKGEIEIIHPFDDLIVDDDITVYAGCNRSRPMCIAKFDNLANFGGFPFIPLINPFKDGVI